MQMLYKNKQLFAIPKEPCTLDSCVQVKKLATTITKALDNNKKEVNGKRRILSIVAEDYSLEQLKALDVNI
jgi:hypothetical protein